MSGPEAEHFAFLGQGRFMLQRLDETGEHVFYPRYLGAVPWSWVEAGGAGTVYSRTIVRQKPERGGDYCIALVELAEGPRMLARILGRSAGEVVIGMPVRASVEKPEWNPEGSPLVVFRPMDEPEGEDHAA